MDCLLLTEEEAAGRLGVSPGVLRTERANRRIEFVKIGSKVRYRPGAIEDYIARRAVPPCPDAIKDQGSSFSTSEAASTSSGMSADASDPAARGQAIVQLLRSPLPTTSAARAGRTARANRTSTRS